MNGHHKARSNQVITLLNTTANGGFNTVQHKATAGQLVTLLHTAVNSSIAPYKARSNLMKDKCAVPSHTALFIPVLHLFTYNWV